MGIPVGTHYDHHVLNMHNFNEVGISSCKYGCKIYACSCGTTQVIHNRAYGCYRGE